MIVAAKSQSKLEPPITRNFYISFNNESHPSPSVNHALAHTGPQMSEGSQSGSSSACLRIRSNEVESSRIGASACVRGLTLLSSLSAQVRRPTSNLCVLVFLHLSVICARVPFSRLANDEKTDILCSSSTPSSIPSLVFIPALVTLCMLLLHPH